MNSIHNNGENDKSLNEDLDKLGHAYGQLEQDEPPELLDQAILNSAHRAVEKKPHWMQFGWLHGLTTTAVFVLAFVIIMNQREPPPGYENGATGIESVRLQREKTAKKQTAAPAPESATIEAAPEDMAEQKLQRSMYVNDSLQGKTNDADKDARINEFRLEESLVDEADLMADTRQAGAVSEPAPSAEPAAGEMKARVRTDSEIEQLIQDIIKLKQSGDETWKTELESFKTSYPEYPLPDELKN